MGVFKKSSTGCSIFISIIMIIAFIFIATIYTGLIILTIGSFIFLINSIINLYKINKMSPSKNICPNCKSKNLKFRYNNNYINQADLLVNTNTKREALCEDCSFMFDYLTVDEIKNNKSKYIGNTIFSLIVFAVSLIGLIYFTIAFTNEDNSENNYSSTTVYKEII